MLDESRTSIGESFQGPGCIEERHTVMLQSHLCHTFHNYSLFSKNALFIIGDWDNNCAGVALKPGALQRADTMRQTCENEEEHNLHKPTANRHLTGIVCRVYNHEWYCICASVFKSLCLCTCLCLCLCLWISLFQNRHKVRWDRSLSSYQSQASRFFYTAATTTWCSDTSCSKFTIL